MSIHGQVVMNLCKDKMVDFLCFDLEREMCEEGYYIGVHLAHLRSSFEFNATRNINKVVRYFYLRIEFSVFNGQFRVVVIWIQCDSLFNKESLDEGI